MSCALSKIACFNVLKLNSFGHFHDFFFNNIYLVTTLLMTMLTFTWKKNKNNVQEIKEKYKKKKIHDYLNSKLQPSWPLFKKKNVLLWCKTNPNLFLFIRFWWLIHRFSSQLHFFLQK